MRKLFVFLAMALCSSLPAAALTVDEIGELLLAGLSERTLRDQIVSEGATFQLDAGDLLKLHYAGATDPFLRFLIGRPPTAADAEPPAVEPQAAPDPTPPPMTGDAAPERYRAEQRDGRVVLVFTNLDDDGNRLPDSPEETRFSRIAARAEVARTEPQAEPSAPIFSDPSFDPITPLIQVIVNAAPPPPSPAVTRVPYGGFTPQYPYAIGGSPGFIDFPDQLPFLGYTIDNSWPKSFTGFGMPLFNDQKAAAARKAAAAKSKTASGK